MRNRQWRKCWQLFLKDFNENANFFFNNISYMSVLTMKFKFLQRDRYFILAAGTLLIQPVYIHSEVVKLVRREHFNNNTRTHISVHARKRILDFWSTKWISFHYSGKDKFYGKGTVVGVIQIWSIPITIHLSLHNYYSVCIFVACSYF